MEAKLLLDTGATTMILHDKTARRLRVTGGEWSRARIASGKTIHLKYIRLDSVRVGPHVREDVDVGIIQHKGPPVVHEGLLGMNFLKGLNYTVDFQRKLLLWVPSQPAQTPPPRNRS